MCQCRIPPWQTEQNTHASPAKPNPKPTDAGYGQAPAPTTDTDSSNPDPDKPDKWHISGHTGHLWAKYPKVCKSTTPAIPETQNVPVGKSATIEGAVTPSI